MAMERKKENVYLSSVVIMRGFVKDRGRARAIPCGRPG
jgi:hypothetical protein